MMLGPVSWILLSPALGGLLILLVPSSRPAWVRRIAQAATLIPVLVVVWLLFQFDRTAVGYQFVDKIPWIESLGISYQVGLDGISLALVLLHSVAAYSGVLISYAIKQRVKEYYLFYLLLITGVFGVFTSLDMFFFYFFYEMAVIPMYPLIGIWGSDGKEYATMKLTLYLTAGAVIALVGLLAMYWASPIRTFDMIALEKGLSAAPFALSFQRWVFPLILVGFGIIAPMWPFHSWSPIGHAAAPSAVSMLHAGVLMKLGSYAIIRMGLTFMPGGAHLWLPLVAVLCVFNIIYGGFVAMYQKDMKFIIGYSSSSHMGYVLLGIACLTNLSLSGAVFFMVAHGWMTALAFALIGAFYDQTHTRSLPDLGGLAKKMPFVATCFVIAAMASSGVPGFANFPSELMIFAGSWDAYKIQSILAIFGIVITAVYMLRAVRGCFFGPMNPKLAPHWDHLRDTTTPFQKLPYAILITALLIFGFWPNGLLDVIQAGTNPLIQKVAAARPVPVILSEAKDLTQQ